MKPIYKIHPAIGVARLGNSDEFYLAPEATGDLPIVCEPDGTVEGPEQKVTQFKDDQGRIKRQGARFRVFVYDDRSPSGRELQINDPITVLDPVSGQVSTGTLADIQWTVYLANKKASWYAFQETDGEHGYAPGHPLRNANVTDADSRQKLIIDPGPQTVSVTGTGGYTTSAQFALGKNPTNSQNFPPPLTPNSITTLGEIMSNPQGNFGRLVVLGGLGNSGSIRKGLGEPVIRAFANNDGWFDDISDGPVTAQLVVNVTAIDNHPVPPDSFNQATVAVDKSAWVITGYPRYAPQIVDIVTLDDVVYDLSVRNFAYNTYMYGIPPFPCDAAEPADLQAWSRLAKWNPNYLPYFWRDIWPIIQRPYFYQFVMDFDPLTGGDPHQTGCGAGGNMDPEIIAIPPFHGENPDDRQMRAQRRMFVYQMLRKPGGENSLTIPDPPSDRLWHYYAMPYLCGDNCLSNVSPSKFLRLTNTMLFILRQWAAGKFINEKRENLPPTVVPPGVQLDRGSLGNVLGGAFCPGAEACWIVRNPAIYSEPYRINQATPAPGGLSQPAVVADADAFASLSDGLEPGDLTKYDALPWQADFNECSNQPIDITYEQWNDIYPESTGDPVQDTQQLTYWWPAHRPMEVTTFVGPPQMYSGGLWSPTPQNHQGDLMMVTEWANLGFILKNPAAVPGVSDPEFVNVPSGNADDLPGAGK
jgi:L-Lysine epsilon oxidase N-terminal/L-lysine epsilon oxidase C-terminal domain